MADTIHTYSPLLSSPVGSTGTGLDQLIAWDALDGGLAGANEAPSIAAGIAAADGLNRLLITGLQSLGLLNKEVLTSADIVALNGWVRADSNRLAQFIALHGNDPKKVGTPADFNGQSIKFCHKVFAISHAICTAAVSAHQPDWVVWLDADVVTHARPNWSEILPPSADLVYLGRDPEKHPHWKMLGRYRPICSETGFVGYRITPSVVAMADAMRMFYMTGELYTRPSTDWHDAKVFDLCRERSAVPKDRWLNLSHEVPQTDVWPLVPVLAR